MKVNKRALAYWRGVVCDIGWLRIFSSANLGCPGIQLGKRLYIDLFECRGMFANVNGRQYWWTLNSLSTGKVRNNFRRRLIRKSTIA